MFKVKDIKTEEIITVLDTYCDGYGKTWFLIWNDKWVWRAAEKYCPPNYPPKFKTIIAGSRSFVNYQRLCEALDKYKNSISEVVCGEAKGADTLGKNWAIYNDIPVKSFPADWQKYGESAGMIRNQQMGLYADRLIAFWDGKSTGTQHMIQYMKNNNKEVIVVNI